MSTEIRDDEGHGAFLEERRALWEANSPLSSGRRRFRAAYQKRLEAVYQAVVDPGRRVLELGCGEGDLLASLSPSTGVGIDFSPRQIEAGRKRHPHLTLRTGAIDQLDLDEKFDVIVLSDVVNDLWDIQRILSSLHRVGHSETRLILNFPNRVWQPFFTAIRRLGLARPVAVQSWITPEDLVNLLRLAGFETIRAWGEVLCPLPVPVLGPFLNRYLAKLWPFPAFALTNFIVARPEPENPAPAAFQPTVSVIVPARNEAGNIEAILRRVPEMGGGTEILFVEGHSKDDTYGTIERALAAAPGRNCRLFRQPGRGKGDAVRLGFLEARGDVLMILDADLTVPPEALPAFFEAIRSRKGEFINGVRLVYPMERNAMRFANLVANRFFSLAFSYLLGQNIKDTLCGTKVLWRKDYPRFQAMRAWFGDFDPFGDFDLIFAAAKLHLRVVDLPIRYRDRVYGATNIQRWRHGLMLLRMVVFAARRIKFV